MIENVVMFHKTDSIIVNPKADINRPRRLIIQNFLVIWLDRNKIRIDEKHHRILAQVQHIVHDVDIFNDIDECIDYLTDIKDRRVFLVIETTTLAHSILPSIHDIPQLSTIYVLCADNPHQEQWKQYWSKIQGVHTTVTNICQCLEQSVKQYNQDNIAISFVPFDHEESRSKLDQIEPSFMYTQVFKEILLQLEHDKRKSIEDFTNYCLAGNYGSLSNITRF